MEEGEKFTGCFCQSINGWMCFSGCFPCSLNHEHALVSPLFTSQWKISLHVFTDCWQISSPQTSRLHLRLQSIATCNSVKLLYSAFISLPTLCTYLISQLLPLPERALFCRVHLLHQQCYIRYIYLVFFLINGLGDKCCWRQPFSPTLKLETLG